MEENAVKEAASAGIQSVEKFLRLISQQQQDQQQQQYHQQQQQQQGSIEYKEIADVAVNKFKKVISLLDRGRTGHARFRRAPLPASQPQRQDSPPPIPSRDAQPLTEPQIPKPEPQQQPSGSAFKVYCPTPVLRLPPLPHNSNSQAQPRSLTQPTNVAVLRPADKKESATTINFSPSPSISAANSFMSSLTGDADSTIQASLSSGFQLTNLSQSSAGKPPLSSSFKRKCSSVDDAALRCGASSSGRCHCSKKRSTLLHRPHFPFTN